MRDARAGQSLIELIVAMAVGVILVVGGIAAVAPILKTSSDVTRIQTAVGLGRGLLDNAKVLAESNWHAIDALATTSANRYYVIASTSPFTVATGTESVTVSTTTYTRFFYLDDVFRNSTGQIEVGANARDPSTKRITVVYGWAVNASNTIVSYLTRARSEVYFMTDWSGGGNQTAPVTATGTRARFATSSAIDYTGTAGSVVITGF